MKITEILKDKSIKEVTPVDATTVMLDGAIVNDSATSYFRLYPRPEQKSMYLLIHMDDVVADDDIYEYTAEERVQNGHVNERVFRVPLRHGAIVQAVEVRIGRVGELIGSNFARSSGPIRLGCEHDASCRYHCCYRNAHGLCYCSECCVSREGQSQANSCGH